MKIGLTGGIASGKSTVADLFADLGVPVIDTDVIAREVVEPGQPALAALVETFGDEILDATGRLDRRSMRRLVFADDAARRKLEGILHPVIGREMRARSDAAGGAYQILVVPLLFETGMQRLVDRVLVVDCPPERQIERLMARDGETRDGALRILDAQIDRADRLGRADDVLVNDGSRGDLADRVAALHERYRQQAARAQRGDADPA